MNIGIIDYDEVDLNNLPRQILHRESFLGKSKSKSAKDYALSVNSQVNVQTFEIQIDDTNALELLRDYDIVIDCTDNMATRYLLNDACVLLKKPLVSGSALQMEGQLTIYNYENGPCYRCIFPTPPPPETVSNCSEGGILGAITGTIGSLQALEALKIAGKFGEPLTGKLLLFDGLLSTFRTIKLRPRRKDCGICSEHPTITKLINYEQFCGMKANDKDSGVHLLTENDRITVENYKVLTSNHLLIDVRTPMEFKICKLQNSVNIPMKKLINGNDLDQLDSFTEVYCVCRRGNDSQLAVDFLRKKFMNKTFKDIKGGLHAWHYKIDKDFPIY
ncbi:MOCS3 family protein [Megaselia abdita]